MLTKPVTDMYGREIKPGSWVAWGKGSQPWPHIGEVVQLEPFKVDCYTGGQGVGFRPIDCVLTERPDYESALGRDVDFSAFIQTGPRWHNGKWFDGPHRVTEFSGKSYWTVIEGRRVKVIAELSDVLREALVARA